MKPEAFVADWKRKEVSAINDFVQSAPVVGLVDVSGGDIWPSGHTSPFQNR